MKRIVFLFLACLLLAAPAAAQNVRGYVSANIILRAGPDMGYPVVTVLRVGTPVYVYGCTDDWGWCDVDADDVRGWVAADYITYPYDGRTVVVHEYGPSIGIPVISFVIGAYWGSHYRDRPFYREREVWYRRPMPRRPPPTRTWYRTRSTMHTREIRPVQPPPRSTEYRPVQSPRPTTGSGEHRPPQPVANPRQAPPRNAPRPTDNRRGTGARERTKTKVKDHEHGH